MSTKEVMALQDDWRCFKMIVGQWIDVDNDYFIVKAADMMDIGELL